MKSAEEIAAEWLFTARGEDKYGRSPEGLLAEEFRAYARAVLEAIAIDDLMQELKKFFNGDSDYDGGIWEAYKEVMRRRKVMEEL